MHQDPGATWNPHDQERRQQLRRRRIPVRCANAQAHGCANGLNGAISPRILAIALFKPSDVCKRWRPRKAERPITNFAGMFMLKPGTLAPWTLGTAPPKADEDNVCGYLVATPGAISSGADSERRVRTLES